MESFGTRFRQALEHHGLRPGDVSSATGLEMDHLEALQRDDFDALPGDQLLLQGLRSFALLIDADPDQVIADFQKARRQAPRQSAAVPGGPTSSRLLGRAVMALVIVVSGAGVFFLWPRGQAPREPGARETGIAQAVASAPRVPAGRPAGTGTLPHPPQTPPPMAQSAPIPPASLAPAPPPKPEVKMAPAPLPPGSGASIPELGVGRGIAGHDLTGQTTRFTEGERVYFWTRIEGAAGQTIQHVWLHDGKEVLRVPIRVQAKRWRSHSWKVLNHGSSGKWVVEARDSSGRVLARREFSCRPR